MTGTMRLNFCRVLKFEVKIHMHGLEERSGDAVSRNGGGERQRVIAGILALLDARSRDPFVERLEEDVDEVFGQKGDDG